MLHAHLWWTTMAVACGLLVLCLMRWLRPWPLAGAVIVVHRILGLLVASAACLGALRHGSSVVPVLHGVYSGIWLAVWFFQWRLLERYAPPGRHAQYWAVSSLLLVVLLNRIAQTGATP